jgi:hypothetical protein
MIKAASVKDFKIELTNRSHDELREIILHLAKFKKENKEFLTYLLYEATDEEAYIRNAKLEMDVLFSEFNTSHMYFVKKHVRKILRLTKNLIRYSKKKQTEVELLIHFCRRLNNMNPSVDNEPAMQKLMHRQLDLIRKSLNSLHEDLRFDYEKELETI